MKFVFYNVENLFDFDPNSTPKDETFGPTGKRKWDQEKYNDKLDRIAEVAMAIGEDSPPAFLALCEVENYRVVKALIDHPNLKDFGYEIVHAESPDERGIGVALAYDPKVYKVESQEWINIKQDAEDELPTRDILHVSGLISGDRTLHIYVNHWPSRRLGPNVTQARRMSASQALVDSLKSVDLKNDFVVLCGDFNDLPSDPSLTHLIDEIASLSNLASPLEAAGLGSVNHGKEWLAFDQFIVNQKMLAYVEETKMHVFADDLVLYENHFGEKRPNRTYMGARYIGGYSDHLAISLNLNL